MEEAQTPVQYTEEYQRQRDETCSQCGEPFSSRACGPTHALIAHERHLDLVLTPQQKHYVDMVIAERLSQDAKWGDVHERHLPLTLWLAVLAEEFGEVAEAILKGPLYGKKPVRMELVDVMATALAMLEALDTSPFGLEEKQAG